ncbi:MAG: transposase [Gammaproteobacteria bacterium]
MVCWDETGHTFRARVGTTWAPRGLVPPLERLSGRREVSSILALTAPLDGTPARLAARHFLGSIHGVEVIAALRYFRRQLGQPLVIVWDHLSAHTGRAVATFVAAHRQDFRLEWLPGYAPELNPEEQCNQWIKHDLLNAVPPSVEALRRSVRGRVARLQHRPDLLRHCFEHAGLSLN